MLDSLTDIIANKVSALFDRAQPKDYVDVYFLTRDHGPLDDLVETARRKHLGLDDYFLAMAFARVRDVGVLPRMVRPLTISELQSFFLDAAADVMKRIDSGAR